MSMTNAEKRTFISEDLYYELRCLLGAATVWRAFQKAQAGFDVVVAMDAAFVHARNLFNFLAQQSSNDICVTKLGAAAPFPSQVYKDWKDALHQHVLHIREGRLAPNNVVNGQHINEQVESFAREVLRLWHLWEAEPGAAAYVTEIQRARTRAVADAANDAGQRISPLF